MRENYQNSKLKPTMEHEHLFKDVVKRVCLFALILCLSITDISVSAAEKSVPVTGVVTASSVNAGKGSNNICVGDSLKLTVKTKKKVSWSSSKKNIISVNKNGVIKAKKKGKATITAKYGKKTKRYVYTVRTHVYKDATCTKPKTCKFCGSTKGKKLDHKWKKKSSSKTKVCTRCKKKVSSVKENASVTDNIDVYTKLKELQYKYPEGKQWTNDNRYICKWGNTKYIYLGCAAFAAICSDYLYPGYNMEKHTDFNRLKAGDIVRINNNTHSVVVWKITGNKVTLCEGNYNKSIHWGRTMTLKQLEKNMDYIMTRYK